jgi:hypothetical protein
MMSQAITPMTLDNAEIVGWVCLVVGIATIAAGVFLGLTTPAKEAKEAKKQLETAGHAISQADQHIQQARAAAANSQRAGAEALMAAGEEATNAAEDAKAKTEEAKTALEQVASIVGSLPENLRFAGMLVLVGAVLMGVATIQFGGTSLF